MTYFRHLIVRSPLRVLLVLYVILALIYVWATPLFEASDEYPHIGMVEYVVNHHSLPVQYAGQDEVYQQEGSQPPLYYALAAAIVSPFDISNLDDYRAINPHAAIGLPDSWRNKNVVIHDSGTSPFKAPLLPFYLVRLFSVALGAVTISAVYGVGRLIAPDMPNVALLAAGLVAFNPMFLFISASVNNDNLVTALVSVVIYLTLILLRDGFATHRSFLIAFLIALATLAKLSGLVLVPVVVVVALWVAYRDRNLRGLLIFGGLLAGIWLVVAGWWYARNLILYDELFGTNMMVRVAGARPTAFTLNTALSEFEGFRWSFWGVFGLFNIIVPFRWFYILLDVLVFTSGFGLALAVYRLVTERHDVRSRDSLINLGTLLTVLTIGLLAFLQWTAQTYASQGRLLFPYVAAILPLVALGWVMVTITASQVTLRTFPARAMLLPLPLLGLAALVIPITLIAPKYVPLAPVDSIPVEARPVYARFADVTLLGYQVEDRRYAPDDDVQVTMYWQVEAPSERDNSLFLTLVNPNGESLGKVDSYPGAGSLRTSQWQAGALYADSYVLRIAPDAVGRFPLRMQVGWWHYPTQTLIASTNENGQELPSVLLEIGGFASEDVPDLEPIEADTFVQLDPPVNYGDRIRLIGYSRQNNLLQFEWESTGDLPTDYAVFVQVIGEDGRIIGQGDAQPAFPTHYWHRGERYTTSHLISYNEAPPEGEFPVLIGWYDPNGFERLPTDFPDNAYPVMNVRIGEG